MAGDPVVTTDRMVAFLYGATAFESLAAGLAAAADLVAGQPGPWTLHDPERAQRCERLATSLHPTRLAPAADDLAAVTLEAMDTARRGLFDLFTGHRDSMPVHLLHHVETLEARLAAFITDHGPAVAALTGTPAVPPAAATPAPPPVDPEPADAAVVPFPSIDAALRFTTADWTAVIRSRGLSVPDVKRELADRMRAAGRVPPARLSGMKSSRAACELMLRVISDLDIAATAAATGADA